MVGAAEKLVASMSADQKSKGLFAFDDKERTNWNFVPLQDKAGKPTRKGLRLEEMNADVDALLSLRARLAQLRSETLDRFSEGELDDNQLMTSFLAHVGAARDNVTRLILQRRGQSPNVGNGSPQAGASSHAESPRVKDSAEKSSVNSATVC